MSRKPNSLKGGDPNSNPKKMGVGFCWKSGVGEGGKAHPIPLSRLKKTLTNVIDMFKNNYL